MKKCVFILLIFALLSCNEKSKNSSGKTPLLEVAGKFLYKEEVNKVIPSDATLIDSADIAGRYIQKWVTEALMYENAQRNITDLEEINKLVEEYRKSLIIHEYEQALVKLYVDEKIPDKEIEEFYNQYKSQIRLRENQIKGVLLILPKDAPQLNEVKNWVKNIDSESLEKIEKYSLKNAISFDYFNKWTPCREIVKRIPLEVEDSKAHLEKNKFTEVSDSTKIYLLSITEALSADEIEPLELAKEKIINIMLNKKKNDFIVDFERSVYNDALQQGEITFFSK